MNKKEFYNILLDGLPTGISVREIVHGFSWTAAKLNNGSIGVAMHSFGNTAPRMFSGLEGMDVRKAAQAVMSWNIEEANEAMAVINACYNTVENRAALGALANAASDGALSEIDLRGKTIGFIGHLVSNHSGITPELLAPAKKYYIMEREPQSGDLPDTACEYVLPECDLVVITGSAAMNKTLPRLLELSEHAQVILTGPSVPLCSQIMELGISRLFGNVIVQSDELCRSIIAAPGSINKFSVRYKLDRA